MISTELIKLFSLNFLHDVFIFAIEILQEVIAATYPACLVWFIVNFTTILNMS